MVLLMLRAAPRRGAILCDRNAGPWRQGAERTKLATSAKCSCIDALETPLGIDHRQPPSFANPCGKCHSAIAAGVSESVRSQDSLALNLEEIGDVHDQSQSAI